jgi:hypothetical protein
VGNPTYVREFRDVCCCVYVTLNWPLHKMNVLRRFGQVVDRWLAVLRVVILHPTTCCDVVNCNISLHLNRHFTY